MDQVRVDDVLKKNVDKVNQIAKKLGLLLAKRKTEAKEVGDLIGDHIYLGSYSAACNKQWLKEAGIKRVLMCLEHLKPPYPDEFQYLQLPIRDTEGQNIAKHFEEAYNFIDNAVKNGENILVHCFAGVSRAPSILASYFIKKDQKKVEDVLNMIQMRRNKINPNRGFFKQLKDLSEEVRKDIVQESQNVATTENTNNIVKEQERPAETKQEVNEQVKELNTEAKTQPKVEQQQANNDQPQSPQQLQLTKRPLSQQTTNMMTTVLNSILGQPQQSTTAQQANLIAEVSEQFKTKESGIYPKKATSIEYVIEKAQSLGTNNAEQVSNKEQIEVQIGETNNEAPKQQVGTEAKKDTSESVESPVKLDSVKEQPVKEAVQQPAKEAGQQPLAETTQEPIKEASAKEQRASQVNVENPMSNEPMKEPVEQQSKNDQQAPKQQLNVQVQEAVTKVVEKPVQQTVEPQKPQETTKVQQPAQDIPAKDESKPTVAPESTTQPTAQSPKQPETAQPIATTQPATTQPATTQQPPTQPTQSSKAPQQPIEPTKEVVPQPTKPQAQAEQQKQEEAAPDKPKKKKNKNKKKK